MGKPRKVSVQVVAASWELNVFSSMTYLDTSRQKPSPRILLGQTVLHFVGGVGGRDTVRGRKLIKLKREGQGRGAVRGSIP